MQLMLIINPGSTSTKLAIYDGTKLLKEETIYHSNEELKSFSSINDQIQFRQNLIKKFIQKNKFDLQDFNVVVARGGLLRPIPGGVYTINQPMLADLKSAKYGSHASNLGAMIAYELALPYKLPAFIVDPVVTDELSDMARISGSKLFPRRSVFHALNQKAVARKYANSINRKYESLNLIVCHLGGGITVGWHHHGKVIDVNDGLGGEGPFSPERAGSVPTFALLEKCFDGSMTKNEIKQNLVGLGGLNSYLGTHDVRKVEQLIKNGDNEATFYLKAMCYQIAKEIGAIYFVANGKIDQLLITGGIAHSKLVIKYLKEYLKGLIPITIYPGENEMEALMLGVKRVLDKKEKPQTY